MISGDTAIKPCYRGTQFQFWSCPLQALYHTNPLTVSAQRMSMRTGSKTRQARGRPVPENDTELSSSAI
jgi:hypothetical protein